MDVSGREDELGRPRAVLWKRTRDARVLWKRTRASRAFAAPFAICTLLLVASSAAARPQTPEKRPFPHRSHVSESWYDNIGRPLPAPPRSNADWVKVEVARDCRGCHDFGEKDAAGKITRPARSVLATCEICHYEGVIALEITQGYERGLREGRGSQSAFEHLDHGNMACRACHAPHSDELMDDFSTKTGVPACMECHTKGGESRTFEPLAGRTVDLAKLSVGFTEWLNADPSMSRADRGPYPHEVHLSREKLADKTACLGCHADVEDASATDLHLKEYTAEECADCHVQRDAPVRVDRAVTKWPSAAALTFAHEDHLGSGVEDRQLAVAGSRAKIDAEGCLTCHEHAARNTSAPDGTSLPPTFVLSADRTGYAGCMSCHDVPHFRAPNHGRWDECTSCHAFGEGDPKTLRPKAAVDRIAVGDIAFQMDAQSHPGLAPKPDQDCAACHRASLPARPSRIAGRRFEHASHLGRDPQSTDCEVCHTGIAHSAQSAAIGSPWDAVRAEARGIERRLTFDSAVCTVCHPGIRVDPDSLTPPARRDVVAFGHADHMGKARDPRSGELVTCSSCHAFDPSERGGDIGVRAEALTCVQCHQHDAEHAAFTGGIGAEGVASCEHCHTSGLPRIGVPLEVDRVRVALNGPQHHPTDRACVECHVQELPGKLAPVSAVLATFPKPGGDRSPHTIAGRPGDKTCYDCHWAIKDNRVPPEQRAGGFARKSDGNFLSNFPGGDKRPQ